jgi:hypothetical protein
MASRFKLVRFLALASAVLMLASVAASPVAAASPTVRIPKSAADWATFTQGEKTAAYNWVWAQEAQMKAAGTWQWSEAGGAPASSGTVSSTVGGVTVTGGTECGIKLNKKPWGTYATAWSSAWTSSAVYYIMTGQPPTYINKSYHNGKVFSSDWEDGHPNDTFAYGESDQDFAWTWDTPTWKVQSWGWAKKTSTVYLFTHLYCGETATPPAS